MARKSRRGAARTNLGAERTSFVGRVSDLERLDALLAEGARLVTVVGPGGVGKTRLARRLAALRLQSPAAGAVWFCDLDETRSAEEVAGVVAAALGVPLASGDGIGRVGRAL